MSNGIVIVGGGLAGGTAAEELREQGYDGKIRLYAAEDHRPHQRPPLSKGFLGGSEGLDAVYLHDENWAKAHNVELNLHTSVTAITPASHTVTLDNGETVSYDKLLIATGATPRHLKIDGSDAKGIHYLRTIEDSEALRDAFAGGGKRVVSVGSGWIGLEVAAAAVNAGNEVTVIGLDKVPLSNAIGEEAGEVFAKLHRDHGVKLLTETGVDGFNVVNGTVTEVRTSGPTLPADLVIVGIGAIPNTKLAEDAGLAVERGVLVDEHMRTSDPDIYAAGDVASIQHPFVGVRMRNEHWATAIDGAKAAAAAMAGKDVTFDAIPYFYTDQYDLGMEWAGYPPLMEGSHVVFRGDLDKREFVAFWVKDEQVVAGMNVNIWDVNDDIKQLITSRKKVSDERLADPAIALTDV